MLETGGINRFWEGGRCLAEAWAWLAERSVELAGLGWPGKRRINVKITWGNYVIT